MKKLIISVIIIVAVVCVAGPKQISRSATKSKNMSIGYSSLTAITTGTKCNWALGNVLVGGGLARVVLHFL